MFPQIFGKYVLERELAAGGMARVYEAKLRGAVGFEKRLVVKQIRPELASDSAFVDRFVDEAKTAVELSHPNIVPVYELGVEQGVYYIAMELCEGATLAEILRETGPLSPEEGAFLGAEICRGLDYAHRRVGIVHRDVTPRNVLVDEEGAVRVIDFGIAAPSQDGDGSAAAHRREILGSPGHMPPEQLAGDELGPETDVFAVGALLIEAWTGRPPFRRATAGDSRDALETPPPRVDADSAALAPVADVVASAVALNRAERPESAEALARPLRDLVRGADTGDLARRLGERARRARAAAERSTAWGAETSDEREPGAISSGATRTFAAREEVAVAARKGASERPEALAGGEGPSTRKIASDPPPARDAGGSGPRTRKLPSIPPDDGVEDEAAARPEDGDAQRVPLEDTDGDADRDGDRAADPGEAEQERRSLLRPLVLLGAIGAVAYGLSLTGGAGDERREVVEAISADPRASPPETAAAATKPPRPVDAAAVGDEAPAPRPMPAPAPKATASVASQVPSVGETEARAPAARGTLTLTSQPPARVTVAGRTYNATPAKVPLDPGSYAVVFTFGATGERVQVQVQLAPGAARTVHADFEGVTPSASVR